MTDADFKDLLKSIDEMRAIQAGKRKPSRVTYFDSEAVKRLRRTRHSRKS